MHVTYQMYTFINIINLSIQIYPYKTELDLPHVYLNSCLARLMLFIFVPFRPFRPFSPFFNRLNSQPFNFRLPPKQNSLPPFTVYWPFRRTLCPTINTIAVLLLVLLVVVFFYVLNPWYYVLLCILMY